jgi:hypothetical protein
MVKNKKLFHELFAVNPPGGEKWLALVDFN